MLTSLLTSSQGSSIGPGSSVGTFSSGEAFVGATTIRAENEDAFLEKFGDLLCDEDRSWLQQRSEIVFLPTLGRGSTGVAVVKAATASASVRVMNIRHLTMSRYPFMVFGHDNSTPGLTTDGKHVACLDSNIRDSGMLAALVVPKFHWKRRRVVVVGPVIPAAGDNYHPATAAAAAAGIHNQTGSARKYLNDQVNDTPNTRIHEKLYNEEGPELMMRNQSTVLRSNNQSSASYEGEDALTFEEEKIFNDLEHLKRDWHREKTTRSSSGLNIKSGLMLRQETRELSHLLQRSRDDALLARAFGVDETPLADEIVIPPPFQDAPSNASSYSLPKDYGHNDEENDDKVNNDGQSTRRVQAILPEKSALLQPFTSLPNTFTMDNVTSFSQHEKNSQHDKNSHDVLICPESGRVETEDFCNTVFHRTKTDHITPPKCVWETALECALGVYADSSTVNYPYEWTPQWAEDYETPIICSDGYRL
jgi:hypothetical protein